METPLRIAVDFDGVLHNPKDKLKGYKMGKPIPGAPLAMKQLKDKGAILVIHSVWADTEQKCQAMAEWCRYFKISYDFITNKKPMADVYLDDKAIRFTNWEEAMKAIWDTTAG